MVFVVDGRDLRLVPQAQKLAKGASLHGDLVMLNQAVWEGMITSCVSRRLQTVIGPERGAAKSWTRGQRRQMFALRFLNDRRLVRPREEFCTL